MQTGPCQTGRLSALLLSSKHILRCTAIFLVSLMALPILARADERVPGQAAYDTSWLWPNSPIEWLAMDSEKATALNDPVGAVLMQGVRIGRLFDFQCWDTKLQCVAQTLAMIGWSPSGSIMGLNIIIGAVTGAVLNKIGGIEIDAQGSTQPWYYNMLEFQVFGPMIVDSAIRFTNSGTGKYRTVLDFINANLVSGGSVMNIGPNQPIYFYSGKDGDAPAVLMRDHNGDMHLLNSTGCIYIGSNTTCIP